MGKNFVLQKFEISSGSPTTPLFLAEDMSIWDLNTKCNIFKNMFFNEVRAIQAWNSCWFDKIHNIYVAQSWIYSTCTYDAVQSSCCCWICLGTLRVRTFITSFLSFFLSFFQKQELMHLSEEEKQQSGRQISPTWVLRERCWCNTSWQIIKDLAIKIKEALFIWWNCPWILFMISGRELESRERIRIKVLNDTNKFVNRGFYTSYDLLQSITISVDLWQLVHHKYPKQ